MLTRPGLSDHVSASDRDCGRFSNSDGDFLQPRDHWTNPGGLHKGRIDLYVAGSTEARMSRSSWNFGEGLRG
jgi:hypothetical protein